MPRFNYKTYKPFECDIIGIDSTLVTKVLINFGTVICTASNSIENDNYFIPEINGVPLKRQNEKDFIQDNTLVINGSRGCICLKITLRDLNINLAGGIESEWYNIFIAGGPSFKNYIQKYVSPSIIRKRITTNLDNYDYNGANTGLTLKKLIPNPNLKPGDFIGLVDEEETQIADAGRNLQSRERPIWLAENSAYYVLVDIGTEEFNAKPLDICFDHNLFPLVNISNIISDVSIEFIQTTNTKEIEEKLDKYNFILNNVKYIPIAWIDINQNPILEQIVNFDYIYSFPHYFSKKGTTDNKIQIFQKKG